MHRASVFLVDDNQAYRLSLRFLLEEAGLDVEDFDSAAAFLQAFQPGRSGCLVLDVRMPEMTGLELQELLADNSITIPIIFITGHGDIPMSVKAMKRGAVDFIEKPFDAKILINAINEAFDRDLQNRKDEARKSEVHALYARLTARESQVMMLVIAGKSNKQIATELNVSHRTVEVHRARVMEKMESSTLAELINVATLCGVLEDQ